MGANPSTTLSDLSPAAAAAKYLSDNALHLTATCVFLSFHEAYQPITHTGHATFQEGVGLVALKRRAHLDRGL